MTAAGGTGVTAQDADGRVSLGVDFGATGVRALFAVAGQPVRRLDLPADEWPWLVCAPAAAGVLPVVFPSVKSLLGSGSPVPWRDGTEDADAVAARMLRALRERVEARAGAVTQTVISVPAAFQSRQRQALRDAAAAAGLVPVRLISDSLAAVMGHTTDRDSGTFLVYGMGYDGFELGLVRGVRGHYRALGYDGAATSGGRAFDEAALASAVRLLRAHRGPASVSGGGARRWLGHRERAQEAREELGDAEGSAADSAALTLDLGTGPPLRMRITRPHLDAFLEPHVRRTVRRAHDLLGEAALTRPDVDTLLLVGGATRLAQVRSGVADLGRSTAHGPRELLALGALKHAVRLAGGGASASGAAALEEGPLDPPDPGRDTLADAPSLTATLLAPDDAPGPARRDVAQARELAGQGRRREAVALLRDIVAEARELLEGLTGASAAPEPDDSDRPPPQPSGPPEDPAPQTAPEEADPLSHAARRQLARARALLDLGRYEHAVQASHLAWQEATAHPARADVLDAMIDVHCAAAMADVAPDHFPDAERWLRCAYGHDPTNERVRALLARRTYRHARELHRRGARDEAIEALGKCLTWDPEHPDAEALLARLSRDGRNRRGRGDVLD
ncbi:Chaperone protein DnaK [Streptomyces sp. YIM 121038]|uniref:Hsp70 family protein n=1 Tax=Streptomyces sp. YIM 121038 TaxID=2136401 RepID=UPI00111001CC|nr:Hsp70 family protein [Streptomyces sp. YIM 121038]QCX79766.1 Chaperone protein DnaK [Streptomyces sp. YIM 121038]